MTEPAVRVFSSLMLVMGVAPILAPLLGGWIVDHHGWRSVFYVLVGAGTICFFGAVFLLPESLPPERRQRHSIAEMLQLYRRLFTHRIFIVHTLTLSLGCAALFAYVGGSPGLFIETYHIPAQKFGFFFGANAFCLIAMSQASGYLAHRADPRKTLRIALAVSLAASAMFLLLILTGRGGLWGAFTCLFVFLGTFGFIFPNTTVLAMSPHGANAGKRLGTVGILPVPHQRPRRNHCDQSPLHRPRRDGGADGRMHGIDSDHSVDDQAVTIDSTHYRTCRFSGKFFVPTSQDTPTPDPW